MSERVVQAPTTPFTLLTPGRIVFGRGAADGAAAAIAAMGLRPLVVRGQSVAWVDTLIADLTRASIPPLVITARGEPDLPGLIQHLAAARAQGVDVVVAVGGGSVIDLGKALAALLPAPQPPLTYLEVVGKGEPLTASPLPFIAIPTTAGTGAEATKNAVIAVPEHGRKVSLRDDRMLPDLALIDAGLTDGAPREVTLASGLDAITQVIEPYLSARANTLTDALCVDAIPRGLAALVRLMACEDPGARDALAYVSHVSGIALANAGLGAVHGFAGVIGGRTGAAHGAVCGRLLVPVLQANRAALLAAGRDVRRFDDVAGWIGQALGVPTSAAVACLGAQVSAWGLPGLGALGVDAQEAGQIAQEARVSSSMKGNPVALPHLALMDILAAAA
ncbi:iron-containing alcohol dehydrogenase [Roseicitreum antarcticum]|uniref:Uncharacterized protein n=1 Tax=Roseicitreum antarcticum TaxID=564137 RepID=A0A1H2S0N6_9RHOB|nr:iron-containing alcohol dehydrogenase [Roseicitreum antarcticum]SDW25040.1 hypothetical protein SAMN04488238_101466 [Roseicitreum antarcticum]